MNQLYSHAWYARRFFNKVSVSEETGPHYGMGLDCYVQWTSPIRRLTDLQVIQGNLGCFGPTFDIVSNVSH
jgi:exoribonuclease II